VYEVKISVLLINYNHEKFLPEALDSVVAQDYEDLEIVVADDCSTDRSREIIKAYANAHPGKFVFAFRDKNGGITQNAITGFRQCSGDLISYLDADDIYLPGKLRAQAKLFEDPRVVLSYNAARVFDSSTGRTLHVTNRLNREDISGVEDLITKMGLPHTSSMMVRRSACPPYGFDPRIPHASDWLFEIEVAMRGEIAKLDGVFTCYRQHANSASAKVRTFENEFEHVLDIVEEKYGARPGIAAACRRGRARLLAGQAFRNLASNPVESRRLLRRCYGYFPYDLRFHAAYVATFPPLRGAALRAKQFLKRYVG
jgi:glycosyltransferase involved in cell wall biosynthesis